MYKLKIMNYKNYEYEILQDELNKISSQGYETNAIHWITLFKKTDQKYYYIVDLFHPEGKSHYDKNIHKQKFLDYYLDNDYQNIYHQKELYVFKGKNKISSRKKSNPITNKSISKTFLLFIAVAMLSSFFLMNSQQTMTIDFLSSYGATFLYGGLLLLFLTLIYELGLKTFYLSQLKSHFENGRKYAKKKILKIHHIIYTTLFISCFLLIIGGSIEDFYNAKNITTQEYPILTLNNLNIKQATVISYTKHTGFQIPEYHHYLEYTQDEKYILQIKEYIFHSQEDATNTWNELASIPEQYQCDQVKQKNNVIYGYSNQQLSSLIILHQEHVYRLSINFHLTNQQISTILKYYQ